MNFGVEVSVVFVVGVSSVCRVSKTSSVVEVVLLDGDAEVVVEGEVAVVVDGVVAGCGSAGGVDETDGRGSAEV